MKFPFTPFHFVINMQEAFGNAKGDPLNPNWTMMERQAHGIKEEWKELADAINSKNLNDARDALCDIMVFALGTYHELGLDADLDMFTVVEAVMSRLCHSVEEAEATQAKYAKIGVTTYLDGTVPKIAVKSSADQTGTDGAFYPKGKFLKSVNYKQPVFLPPVHATKTP